MSDRRLSRIIALSAAVAGVAVTATLVLDPLSAESGWWVAFGTLYFLSLASVALSIKITPGGARSSMDFIPYLAGAVLLGPSGSALLSLGSFSIFQWVILNKPVQKATFNTAQVTTAATAAGWVFTVTGGTPSFTDLGFPESLLPFFAAVVVYFAINTTAVSVVVAEEQGSAFSTTWSNLAGRLIGFDVFVSPVAYGVAYLDIAYGHVTLLLALVPLYGLRYTYGANLELQNLNTDLLRTMMRVMESQDPYTSGHSVRVAQYSQALAEELGVGLQKMRNVERAALLHDIGKIDRAYREILVQEGPLSEEQRNLIEKHPERGVDLLSSVRALDDEVRTFIRHHHERYDGTGYPDGLGGEEIPLGSRIIMVADTIDAMLTARSYRDALSADIVQEELRENAGEQFDPQVVEMVFEIDLVERAEKLIENQQSEELDPASAPTDLPTLEQPTG